LHFHSSQAEFVTFRRRTGWRRLPKSVVFSNSYCVAPKLSIGLEVRLSHIGTRPNIDVLGDMDATSSGHHIAVEILGITIDSTLSFLPHVHNVVRSCSFRALRHIRLSLPREIVNTIVCSIDASKLDCCNSLLYGVSSQAL